MIKAENIKVGNLNHDSQLGDKTAEEFGEQRGTTRISLRGDEYGNHYGPRRDKYR
jgi:hypothetical protein